MNNPLNQGSDQAIDSLSENIDDTAGYRAQFPALTAVNAPVYLDSAATAQMPATVIARLTHYHQHMLGTVHRGSHQLTEALTAEFEQVRAQVAAFIGAYQ